MIAQIMSIMISENQKTSAKQPARGRPASGVGTPVMVRCQPDFLAALDQWRAAQSDVPNRSEAIRRLVEAAIAAGKADRR